MTSLEIAELTGKQHKDLLRAIRKMPTAWTDVTRRKFALRMKINELANGVKIETPYYQLTKTEYLYIATKFITGTVRKSYRLPFFRPAFENASSGTVEDSSDIYYLS